MVAHQETGVQKLIDGCGGSNRGYRTQRTIDIVIAQLGTNSTLNHRFNRIYMLLTIGHGDHQSQGNGANNY